MNYKVYCTDCGAVVEVLEDQDTAFIALKTNTPTKKWLGGRGPFCLACYRATLMKLLNDGYELEEYLEG